MVNMEIKICECGSNRFYMKQYISGVCHFIVDNHGEPAENYEMHDNLTYRDARKHYRCVDCERIAKEIE